MRMKFVNISDSDVTDAEQIEKQIRDLTAQLHDLEQTKILYQEKEKERKRAAEEAKMLHKEKLTELRKSFSEMLIRYCLTIVDEDSSESEIITDEMTTIVSKILETYFEPELLKTRKTEKKQEKKESAATGEDATELEQLTDFFKAVESFI